MPGFRRRPRRYYKKRYVKRRSTSTMRRKTYKRKPMRRTYTKKRRYNNTKQQHYQIRVVMGDVNQSVSGNGSAFTAINPLAFVYSLNGSTTGGQRSIRSETGGLADLEGMFRYFRIKKICHYFSVSPFLSQNDTPNTISSGGGGVLSAGSGTININTGGQNAANSVLAPQWQLLIANRHDALPSTAEATSYQGMMNMQYKRYYLPNLRNRPIVWSLRPDVFRAESQASTPTASTTDNYFIKAPWFLLPDDDSTAHFTIFAALYNPAYATSAQPDMNLNIRTEIVCEFRQIRGNASVTSNMPSAIGFPKSVLPSKHVIDDEDEKKEEEEEDDDEKDFSLVLKRTKRFVMNQE